MGEKLKLDIGLAIAWMSLQVRHNTLITDLRANQRKGVSVFIESRPSRTTRTS